MPRITHIIGQRALIPHLLQQLAHRRTEGIPHLHSQVNLLILQPRLRIHRLLLRRTPKRIPLLQLRQMILVPAHSIHELIYEVADIQVRLHTHPPHHRHRRIIQGNLHYILPRPLGSVHQRSHERGDDLLGLM